MRRICKEISSGRISQQEAEDLCGRPTGTIWQPYQQFDKFNAVAAILCGGEQHRVTIDSNSGCLVFHHHKMHKIRCEIRNHNMDSSFMLSGCALFLYWWRRLVSGSVTHHEHAPTRSLLDIIVDRTTQTSNDTQRFVFPLETAILHHGFRRGVIRVGERSYTEKYGYTYVGTCLCKNMRNRNLFTQKSVNWVTPVFF